MPSMSFPNVVGNQSFPSMSYTTRSPYVRVLHNILRTTPLVLGSSGYGPISPTPASTWAHPQQVYVGVQYYNGAHYNNPLYVPYPGGVSNQWTQPTYVPQAGINLVQPLVGHNTPK